ncbi:MAG: XisI protein [Gemmataceae bacterium]|nr:XisI protein [Gemmataceae bacterium]
MAALNYADILERVLDAYTRIPYAHGDLTCEAIFDPKRGRYVLITVGWDGEERVDDVLVHIDIKDGKLWIQTDNTEHGIAPELVAAGVPKSDIVLAFQAPEVRQHTEYAVA